MALELDIPTITVPNISMGMVLDIPTLGPSEIVYVEAPDGLGGWAFWARPEGTNREVYVEPLSDAETFPIVS